MKDFKFPGASKGKAIGCYNDGNPRALPDLLKGGHERLDGQRPGENYCIVLECARRARDRGLRYFSTQNPEGGTECWGSNESLD